MNKPDKLKPAIGANDLNKLAEANGIVAIPSDPDASLDAQGKVALSKEKVLEISKMQAGVETKQSLEKQKIINAQNEKLRGIRNNVNSGKDIPASIADYKHEVKAGDTVGAIALGVVQGYKKLNAATYGELKLDWGSTVKYQFGGNDVYSCTLAEAGVLFYPGDSIGFDVDGDNNVTVQIESSAKTIGKINKLLEKENTEKGKVDEEVKRIGDLYGVGISTVDLPLNSKNYLHKQNCLKFLPYLDKALAKLNAEDTNFAGVVKNYKLSVGTENSAAGDTLNIDVGMKSTKKIADAIKFFLEEVENAKAVKASQNPDPALKLPS